MLDACRAASGSSTAWVDNAYARSLAPWAILSISGYDDTTRPYKLFKAWSLIVKFIPVYDILISLQSRHLSAPN